MAETPDQVRPLAPGADRPISSDDEETAVSTKIRHKRCIKCCSCIAALLLVVAIIIVILIFTVFRVKDPIIGMNGVTVEHLELINGTLTPRPGSNITLNADVSVRNPNFASFRYQNTTTTLYYHGVEIGEAHGPPGRARARRTIRMNMTVDVMMDRVLLQPDLGSDIGSGMLTMSSFTRIGGRVRMIVVRHVTVSINCSMTFNITSRAIQHQTCRRRVQL